MHLELSLKFDRLLLHVDSLLLGLAGIKLALPTFTIIQTLSAQLRTLRVPFNANLYMVSRLSTYCFVERICSISNACIAATDVINPMTSDRGFKGQVPGWREFVELVKSKSLFWYDIWLTCGKPQTEAVADSMRRFRAAYHYAIRKVHRNEQTIVHERFAEVILANHNRDLSTEFKRIKRGTAGKSSMVDDYS